MSKTNALLLLQFATINIFSFWSFERSNCRRIIKCNAKSGGQTTLGGSVMQAQETLEILVFQQDKH